MLIMMQWREFSQEQKNDLNKDSIESMEGKTGEVILNHK